MNLASFVDVTNSYDPFYKLLDHFFAFYTNSAKKDMSVFIISGNAKSGKTTLIKLFSLVRLMGHNDKTEQKHDNVKVAVIERIWLRTYSKGFKFLKNPDPLTGDIATCSNFYFFRINVDIDYVFYQIEALHKAVNKGITYKTQTETIETHKVINPAVLMLEIKFFKSLGAEYLSMYTKDSPKRKVKEIYLPNKFETFDCFVMVLGEITNIIRVATAYDTWLKYNLFWLSINVTIKGEFQDIFLCFLYWTKNLLPELTITQDWWKIIFKHKAFGKGFKEGIKIYEEQSTLI